MQKLLNNDRNEFNGGDAYKTFKVLSHEVVFMNTAALVKNNKPIKKQRMKRSYVLRNHWLKHAHGIATTAYEYTDDKCVYHQLVEYLSNPPSNRPSPFIYFTQGPRQPVSEESLYRFFCEKIQEKSKFEVFYQYLEWLINGNKFEPI